MLAFLLPLLIAPKFDFFSFTPYDRAIPNPESTLGYEIGSRTTTFRDQEKAIDAMLRAAGNRAISVQYGKSWEGRPLRIIATSSPANMSRLSEILANNARRAEGQSVKMDDPPIVWVNECIHGDETASFESAMPLLYNLLASRAKPIQDLLDRAVVVVNPVYNPDGHERFTVYYNSISVGSSDRGSYEDQEPSAIYGRTNHYRFDMNRDRIAMSQQETRSEVAEFLKWQPQVYIDQHGQVASYFFPPNSMSQNVNVDRERVNKWTEIFGKATGKAFDEHGFGYFIKDTFDLYYPGYLDSFTTLSGAIGMTQETDGGRMLATKRQDGSSVTLRDGVAHHFTAALAVIGAAVERSHDLLESFVSFKASVQQLPNESYAFFGDPRALERLRKQLLSMGIHGDFFNEVMSDTPPKFPKDERYSGPKMNYLAVTRRQPQGHLLDAMVESKSDFEPEFIKAQLAKKTSAPEGENYPGPDGADFYDITGWSLPLAQNLQMAKVKFGDISHSHIMPVTGRHFRQAPVYAIDYVDQDDILMIDELMRAGVKFSIATKQMETDSGAFSAGTFLCYASRNEDNLFEKLKNAKEKYGATISGLSSTYPRIGSQGTGSESVVDLRQPKIGILFGSGAEMGQVGAIWYLMEQVFKLPFTPLSTSGLSRSLDAYTSIVIPSGSGFSLNSKVKEWVQGGGTLIALGDIDWAVGPSSLVELEKVDGDHQYLPGAIFQAQIDMRSFLSYGYARHELPVPVMGNEFYKSRKEGGSVVKFSEDKDVKKLLSGWEWPDETEEALANTTWLQDVPYGRGHVVLFTIDPTDRAMWPGLYKLLLNAMILGPSM